MISEPNDYVPGDHTVQDVLSYVDANPNELGRVLDAERDGAARTTLVNQLEAKQQAGTNGTSSTEGASETDTEVGDSVDYQGERYEVVSIGEGDEEGQLTICQPSEDDVDDNPDITVGADEVTNVSKYQREDGAIIDLTDGSEEYRQKLAEDGVI